MLWYFTLTLNYSIRSSHLKLFKLRNFAEMCPEYLVYFRTTYSLRVY